jgi:hypothetical protein
VQTNHTPRRRAPPVSDSAGTSGAWETRVANDDQRIIAPGRPKADRPDANPCLPFGPTLRYVRLRDAVERYAATDLGAELSFLLR